MAQQDFVHDGKGTKVPAKPSPLLLLQCAHELCAAAAAVLLMPQQPLGQHAVDMMQQPFHCLYIR
jgi:hypothetical protein